MYTQCPQCQTVYRVSSEMLRQAGGQVQCGQCSLRFNALVRLSEDLPQQGPRPEPESESPVPADTGGIEPARSEPGQPGDAPATGATRADTDAEASGAEGHHGAEPPEGGDTGLPADPVPQEAGPGAEPETASQPDTPEDTEEQEYDTWLGRLEQEWDPTRTGTEDAWSRAAPQIDPPPDTPDEPVPPAAKQITGPADDDPEPAQSEQELPAEPGALEDGEGEPEAAAEDPDGQRGLDTGISYIEAWAEDLLAEVERAEKEQADRGEQTRKSAPPGADSGGTGTTPEAPAEEESANQPEPEISAESLKSDEPSPAEPARAPADGEARAPGPSPGQEPEMIPWVAVDASESPDSGSTSATETDAGPGENWPEETWATDTQSFEPEAWLEPDFVDQEPLPEKLEGAAGAAADQEPAEDHAATDPAIPPEIDPGVSSRDEIAGLWPEIDDDAEVEEIVLESEEPDAANADAPPGPEQPEEDTTATGPAASQPAAAAGSSDGAAATAAAGMVQAAAVRVTTADPPGEEAALSEEDAASTMALKAEEVARELGLPRNRPLLRWSLRILALLILLALIAAGVHWQRGALMRNPTLAPVLEQAYGILGMKVQAQWDITAFDILDSAARSTGDDLVVMATFINRADFAQPYPVLRVTLENRWGQAIGQEDFTPRNYLRAFSAGRMMNAGERARAEVVLRSPGSAAEGFSVDVCLASASGSLQCLSDRP